MHSRRALLYVPGDDRHKIEKALTFGVDSICLDMEDGVALNHKADARQTIASALQELDFGKSEKLTRLNPVGSGFEQDDLDSILPFHPDGIVIPKIEEVKQLDWADNEMDYAELRLGWPLKSIRLLAGIETPRGVLNLKEIAAHPRLDALIFGGEDFAAAIGAVRSADSIELLVARQQVVMAAACFGLQAIDIVNIDFSNPDLVKKEALIGARLGFSGKQVIHPDQVAPVQTAFTPDQESIARARQIVAGFDSHQKLGKGVFVLNGKMIDMPMVRNARKVLERAKAAGKV
jgi:citrate lyase beta subunit